MAHKRLCRLVYELYGVDHDRELFEKNYIVLDRIVGNIKKV